MKTSRSSMLDIQLFVWLWNGDNAM